jgi:hypothetical protein
MSIALPYSQRKMQKKIYYYPNRIVIVVNDPDFGEPHDVVMEDVEHSTPVAEMTTTWSTSGFTHRSIPAGKTKSFATSASRARHESPRRILRPLQAYHHVSPAATPTRA